MKRKKPVDKIRRWSIVITSFALTIVLGFIIYAFIEIRRLNAQIERNNQEIERSLQTEKVLRDSMGDSNF